MRRLYLACCLAIACGHSDTGRMVAPPRPIDEVLPCVVDRVIDRLRATRAPLDTLATALDVRGIPSNRAAVRRYITALADRVAAGRDVPLPKPVVQVRAAVALIEGDAAEGAGRLAIEALAASRELSQADRDDVVRNAALAITATGGEVPAEVRQGRDTLATLYAVQGLARSGRRDLARKLLAGVPPPTSVPGRGAYLMALGWLGDLAAARAMLDGSAPRDPMLGVWLASVLAGSKDPEARAAIDRELDELEARARHVASPDEAIEIAGLWSELVWLREQQDRSSAREARHRLDDWLLAKDDARRELLGVNVVRAEIAGDLAEAGRLEKSLALQLAPMARIDLALHRDDPAAALDALEQQKTERQTAESTTRPPPGELRDGVEIGEVTVWLVLAARQSVDPAMVIRFRALACGRSG